MPENQRGQATLLGLVIIVLGLVSLLLLFNSGQLVSRLLKNAPIQRSKHVEKYS